MNERPKSAFSRFIGKLDREREPTQINGSAAAALEALQREGRRQGAELGRRSSSESNLSHLDHSIQSNIDSATDATFTPNRERLSNSISNSIPENVPTTFNTIRKSRALQYTIKNTVVDRGGMISLAKPREGNEGKIVVSGKRSLRLLNIVSNTPGILPLSTEEAEYSRRASYSNPSIAYRRSITGSSLLDDSTEARTVTEIDIRGGSKLGLNFVFTDVSWGYGATTNKVATSFTNGAVVMWDLEKEGSKLDQLKQEHDRTVNRVIFGGASGSWLMSGGQDGQMKLWDVRETRPASIVLRASSPVRHLSFSPSASQPFTVVAACASGALIRYDLRMSGKSGSGVTDRIISHSGLVLAMDWRDNTYEDRLESDRGEGGWLITSGMDKTIKIWNFGEVSLSTKPMRTLYTSQPMQSLSWHPSKSELSCSPIPNLGLNVPASTPTSLEDHPTPFDCSPTVESSGGTEYTNEIQIWDLRREFYPKLLIRTSEAISSIIYNEDDTIYSVAKTASSFSVHDVTNDSYSMIDSYPRASASWSTEGDLIFVDETRKSDATTPWSSQPPDVEYRAVDSPALRPAESFIATVNHFDPDYDHNTFSSLAYNYELDGSDLASICDTNASVAEFAGRGDAAQLWLLIKTWLYKPQIEPPPPSISTSSIDLNEPIALVRSPPATVASPIPFRNRSRRSLQQSPLVKTIDLFPDLVAEIRDTTRNLGRSSFSSNSEATSTADVALEELTLQYKNLNSPRNLSPIQLLHQRPRSLSTTPLNISAVSSSEETDSELEERHITRSRFNAARKSRRTSSNDRGLPLTKENLERESKRENGMMMASILTLRPAIPSLDREIKARPSKKEIKLEADLEKVDEFAGLMRKEIRNILLDYADKGDSQLCATVCAVLQNHQLELRPFFVARVTKSYLDRLRKSRLHVPAARLLKYCSVESLRLTTQNSVVYHVSAGSPKSSICCICHIRIHHDLIVFCPGCGHATHTKCITQLVHVNMNRSLSADELEEFVNNCPVAGCSCSPCVVSASLAKLSPKM